MKFQNPSLNFFLNGQTNGHMDVQTDGCTSRNQYAPHFFKVGGINTDQELTQFCLRSEYKIRASK